MFLFTYESLINEIFNRLLFFYVMFVDCTKVTKRNTINETKINEPNL